MNLRLAGFVVGLFSVIASVEAANANNFPIVLMHGFLGWGRDELAGFKYWGGLIDLQEVLKSEGYSVFTTAVGPVSSSWDRACEAYAMIKGGQVDYGYIHSTRYGHNRYGRTYPGLYPQWGTTVNGIVQKVHLICHSQGGQDGRLLTYLLNSGKAEEKNAIIPNGQNPTSQLFLGNHPWIASVTTLSSPHDGTTLATGVGQFIPFVKNLVAAFAGLAGATREQFYDFKLDQWNLMRDPNEDLTKYVDRVFLSSIWNNNKDLSLWSLSADGAKELNQQHGACDPNVFYLSYTTEATYASLLSRHQLPSADMLPVLWPFATFMGSYTRSGSSTQVEITSAWWPNDGVVNSISQDGPSTGCTIRSYTNSVGVGIFNDMGKKSGWDHLDINGLTTDPLKILFNDVSKFYIALAKTLAALPVVSNQRLDSSPIEVNVTSELPQLEETIPETTFNVTVNVTSCSDAERVYVTMCVNTTSLGSGFSFSESDCADIKTNVDKCHEQLDGNGVGTQSPLSLFIVLISFLTTFLAVNT